MTLQELEKLAFDWGQFREGLVDEGVPLAGATAGAALGGGNRLRGAALGYAAGGAASLLRNKLSTDPAKRNKKMSATQKVLGASALGYGAGGAIHALGSSAVKKTGKGLLTKAFHGGEHSRLAGLVEEALPATGATLGTAVSMGMTPHKKKTPAAGFQPEQDNPMPQTQPKIASAMRDELSKIAQVKVAGPFDRLFRQRDAARMSTTSLPKPPSISPEAAASSGLRSATGIRGAVRGGIKAGIRAL